MSETTKATDAVVGHAGQRGEDVRSDAWVEVTLASQGGILVDLQSKVADLYGEAIRADVARVLGAFGVEHASVQIEDRGALPFVLAARIETAVLRAGASSTGATSWDRTQPVAEPSSRGRRRRSRLYLPGNEPKFMINAGLHEPDGIILDLEDSVHPAEKDAARVLVRNALRSVDFDRCERMVRINQGELGLEDVDALATEGVDVFLVPKVETAATIRAVDARIAAGPAAEDRALWLMPIVESALGIENAYEIATASPRICAMTIGLEDYTADMGVVKTREGDESRYARERLVVAARAAGVQAIDSVYGDVGDNEGLAAWALRSRSMGYVGMGCVHPRQIPVLHQSFAPSEEELEKARRVVEAYEQALSEGRSVVSLGSKMIDPPVVKRALELVRLAQESA